MSRRLLAVAALAAAVVATVVLVSGGDYTLHARFEDAGQLVPGGRVTVAGRKIGSIASVRLTADGQADVRMAIDTRMREGTRATIRAVGQAGLSNRYVELSPGPGSARELPDGAVLGTAQTQGIVNLDALLDSFGPDERADLRLLIRDGADFYAGSGSVHLRSLLGQTPAAFTALDGLFGELADDRVAVRGLIGSAATASQAIASRRTDLTDAVEHSAQTLGAIASERDALADTLDRAPAVLGQAQHTLAGTRTALAELRPVLRDVPATARPLGDVLTRLHRFLPAAEPVARDLTDLLPPLRQGLEGLPGLAPQAVASLRSLGSALHDARPIITVLRLYGSDLIIGALTAIGGLVTGEYNAVGHYAKVNFVESLQTLPKGPLAAALSANPIAPGLLNTRTKLERRCPGGNVPPAPDGSSPWLIGKRYCDPADNTPASVNEP